MFNIINIRTEEFFDEESMAVVKTRVTKFIGIPIKYELKLSWDNSLANKFKPSTLEVRKIGFINNEAKDKDTEIEGDKDTPNNR